MRLKLRTPEDMQHGDEFMHAVEAWLIEQGFDLPDHSNHGLGHCGAACRHDLIVEYEVIGEGQVRFELYTRRPDGNLDSYRDENGWPQFRTHDEVRNVKTLPPLPPSDRPIGP